MNIKKMMTLGSLCLLSMNSAIATNYIYISNKEDGTISSYKLNEKTGKMTPTPMAVTYVGHNIASTVISPDRTYLYALTRDKPYMATSFKIKSETGDLIKYTQTEVPSSYAYNSLDRTGNYLLSASYDDDLVTVHKINQGKIALLPTQKLRTLANAHAVISDLKNKNIYATSLSGQVIHQYSFNSTNGEITSLTPAMVSVAPLTPRHLVTSHNNQYLYVLDETSAKVISYKRDLNGGQLTQIAISESLPPESTLKTGTPRGEWRSGNETLKPHAQPEQDIWAADIHITPDDRFLYTSERTSSLLTLFKIDSSTGIPKRVNSIETEQQPRSFAITPNGKFLISTGEKSNLVSIYNIDQTSGYLTLNDRYPVGKNPIWVSIVDID